MWYVGGTDSCIVRWFLVAGSAKNAAPLTQQHKNFSTGKNPEIGLNMKLKEDPRNDEDYDTFDYGTEPIPGDMTWVIKDNQLKDKPKPLETFE